jgi:hypothetical protein
MPSDSQSVSQRIHRYKKIKKFLKTLNELDWQAHLAWWKSDYKELAIEENMDILGNEDSVLENKKPSFFKKWLQHSEIVEWIQDSVGSIGALIKGSLKSSVSSDGLLKYDKVLSIGGEGYTVGGAGYDAVKQFNKVDELMVKQEDLQKRKMQTPLNEKERQQESELTIKIPMETLNGLLYICICMLYAAVLVLSILAYFKLIIIAAPTISLLSTIAAALFVPVYLFKFMLRVEEFLGQKKLEAKAAEDYIEIEAYNSQLDNVEESINQFKQHFTSELINKAEDKKPLNEKEIDDVNHHLPAIRKLKDEIFVLQRLNAIDQHLNAPYYSCRKDRIKAENKMKIGAADVLAAIVCGVAAIFAAPFYILGVAIIIINEFVKTKSKINHEKSSEETAHHDFLIPQPNAELKEEVKAEVTPEIKAEIKSQAKQSAFNTIKVDSKKETRNHISHSFFAEKLNTPSSDLTPRNVITVSQKQRG